MYQVSLRVVVRAEASLHMEFVKEELNRVKGAHQAYNNSDISNVCEAVAAGDARQHHHQHKKRSLQEYPILKPPSNPLLRSFLSRCQQSGAPESAVLFN